MPTPVDGLEIIPKLWLGSNRTCDVLRQSMAFRCINVGLTSHTNNQRCTLIPVCGTDGFVDYKAQAQIYATLIGYWPQYGSVLIHCGDALTYSPLAMALALQARYQISFAKAYQTVKLAQPGLQDLSRLVQPVAASTA
jgi:hypothetical protein